jgi:hypothetical protein
MSPKRTPALTSVVLALLAAGIFVSAATQIPASAAPFARQIRELSEPGGSFDTDNLISNERSYLHVMPDLKRAGSNGGAYVGVGPDQNFSYIAATRPAVAFIIDVRRDNLLLQLLFKALFELSETRAEYLGHLFGRRLPSPPDQWRAASLDKIAAQLETASPRDDDVQALRKRVDAQIAGFGMPLTSQDVSTIDRFHRTFINAGLSLKFQSYGRAPRSYYPTYRELLFETDRAGRHANFLISEDDYQFVRGLQQRDLVIPVVGNLAGPSALAAIGRAIRQRGDQLSVFYVSNVELYLFQDGIFTRYADTLAAIPHNNRSLLIRSIFTGPGVWSLPDTAPGYASASVTQPVDEFLNDYAARKYLTYAGLVAAPR